MPDNKLLSMVFNFWTHRLLACDCRGFYDGVLPGERKIIIEKPYNRKNAYYQLLQRIYRNSR